MTITKRVLEQLRNMGEATVHEVATASGVNPRQVSGAITGLQRLGKVQRVGYVFSEGASREIAVYSAAPEQSKTPEERATMKKRINRHMKYVGGIRRHGSRVSRKERETQDEILVNMIAKIRELGGGPFALIQQQMETVQ